MSFYNFIALLVASVFGGGLCQSYGETGTDIQVYTQIKNCTQEAIYYTTALKFKCGFFNKPICYDNFDKCLETKGYDSNKAQAICQEEVGPNFLSDRDGVCVVPASNYLNAVQSTCCTKTKIAEQVPGKSFAETQEILESCYDKVNCPGTDSCSTNDNQSSPDNASD